MSEQKITFNVEDVNITDIMEQIHKNMKTRGYDVEELKNLNKELHIPKPVGVETGSLDQSVSLLNSAINVQYWWQIPAQGGIKGRFRVFVNKITRKLTYFYMKHVFDQQNIYNMYAATTINNMQNTIKKLEEDNQELNLKLTALYNQNNSLAKKINSSKLDGINQSKIYNEKAEELEKAYAQRQIELDSIYTVLAARLARLNDCNKKCECSAELLADILPNDTESEHKFDYFLFESKYRGTTDEIKERQRRYLEFFTGQQNVVDIGCGRGEFLQLLSQNNISCTGVDILPENIELCKANKLNVIESDGISYLKSVEDNSLGGIFCAQVIEHLSNKQLIELFTLAHKKLKVGAKIITETLNPQCLMIFAESFYMDPSHKMPVHPYVTKFIAETEGFSKNSLIFMTPSDEKLRFVIDEDDENVCAKKAVNELLFGNREYALIAEK